jgi:hypothetical protein
MIADKNGTGWRVAIGLMGVVLGTAGASGYAYVQVNSVENRANQKIESLKQDVYNELRDHGALLREIDRRLARIEGELAKGRD